MTLTAFYYDCYYTFATWSLINNIHLLNFLTQFFQFAFFHFHEVNQRLDLLGL